MIPEKQMIVVFGATGDLTKRKIIPALYHLYKRGKINKYSPVVCVGRRDYSQEDFIQHLRLEEFVKDIGSDGLRFLQGQIEYVKADFKNENLDVFKTTIHSIGEKYQAGPNKLFYLALPARIFSQAADMIKLFVNDEGWQRVVFEKPFGEDTETASSLNTSIHTVLREDQIFRVDHYLGKELVQNILTLRFHNELFKWAWHKDAIDHIQITASEQLGVEERAGYYDKSGAVRDMVQNHLLQLLSLIAMEPPASDSTEDLRDSSGSVMQALLPVNEGDVVLGQYAGYIDEEGVGNASQTETFAAFKVFVDSPRWKGVPFYLKTGKKLNERYADIKVVFKHDKDRCKQGDCDRENMIIIRIQPDDGIAIAFNVRRPGENSVTESVLMDFCHHCHFGPNTPEAYESILLNVMLEEATAFPRWDWLEGSWKFIDHLKSVASNPLIYPIGSTGPVQSDILLKGDGREWIHGEVSPKRVQGTIRSL